MTALDDAIRQRMERQAAEARTKLPHPLAGPVARAFADWFGQSTTTTAPKENTTHD